MSIVKNYDMLGVSPYDVDFRDVLNCVVVFMVSENGLVRLKLGANGAVKEDGLISAGAAAMADT